MILENLLLAFPLFFLIALGYLTTKCDLMTFEIGRGLAKFAFNIAIPCLLFLTIRKASDLPAPDWRIALAFFGACGALFCIAFFIGRRFFTLRGDEDTIFSMSAIFSNNVQLGLPLAITLLGEQAIGSIALIVSLNVFLLWVVATAGVEMSRSSETSLVSTVFQGILRTLKTPVIFAICIGLMSTWLGLLLPDAIEKSLDLLAASATPVALFSVGVGLAQYKVTNDLKLTSASVTLKLLVQPVLVYVFCVVLGLGKIETQTAVLLGALPVGVNVYIMSQEFGVVQGSTANALLITTVLSVVTVPTLLTFFLLV